MWRATIRMRRRIASSSYVPERLMAGVLGRLSFLHLSRVAIPLQCADFLSGLGSTHWVEARRHALMACRMDTASARGR